MTSVLSNQRGRQRGHQVIPTLDPEVPGYSAVVEAIPGLFAYWRLANPSEIRDNPPGTRHGTYNGSVAIVGSLPVDSGDAATSFPGTVVGTVPPAGLSLPQFTLSFWVLVNSLQTGVTGRIPIISKDQTGVVTGDWSITITEDGELSLEMQETGELPYVVGPVDVSSLVGTPIHLIGLAGDFGFELWVNGRKLDTNTSFTTGWTSNSQPLRFCGAPWTSNVFQGVIDECALYNRVLTDAQIISLSQRTGPPVAVNDSAVVAESQSVTVDVVDNDRWLGREINLGVQVFNGTTWGSSVTTGHGTATVESDERIRFDAQAVSADAIDTVSYRVTDQTGTSNTGLLSVTIQNAASTGGGTLVYDFQPQPAWIDNGSMTVAGSTKVALASRDTDNAIGNVSGDPPFDPSDEPSTNRWKLAVASGGGVLVGSSLVKGTHNKNTQPCCWNRAPTGHPSLEMYTVKHKSTVIDFAIKLYNPFDAAGPRHMRVVMEVRLCRSTDLTTYKLYGVGPTTGSYTNFSVTHEEGAPEPTNPAYIPAKAAIKFFCQLFQGERQEGPTLCNWWNLNTLPIQRVGHMIQTGPSGKIPSLYTGNFDRPSKPGEVSTLGNVKITDNNMYGTWHRLELEIKLTTPSTVPTDARRSNPTTDPNPHTCDGFAKCYVTADLDGERGPTGARTLSGELTGLLFDCRFDDVGSYDNMHTLNNIVGPWLNWHYGGSDQSQGDGWAWLRRLQVYRHDGGGSGGESGDPTPPPTVVNVSTSGTNSGLTFINNIPADRTIQFADGTYSLGGTIIPKTGQYYRGNLSNPAAVVLQGTGNFRAFNGGGAIAPGCVIKSLKITGYDCGMGRNFVPNPTGDVQDARALFGAIEQASGWQILDCHVMANYCSGMTIGNGTRVARCLINDNGHKGIGGGTENNNCRGRDLVIEDNQINNNCRFDMNKTWDSGGIKVIGGATPGSPPANPALAPARNNVFRRNRISNNNGPGIWWDWDVFDGEIYNNSIFLNHASGIVIEASATAHIHHNQIGDNCTGSLPALITFRCNTIGVQNSKRCLIEDNLFYVNRELAGALTQHNRASVDPEIPGSLNTPKGGIYVGWFTGVENEWNGNVWLMQTNGSFTAQLDNHSCSNSNRSCTGVSCSQMCGTSQTGCVITSAPSGPTIGGNFMCFIPQGADNHFNVQDGDVFRIASGTANKWSFHTNSTQITGSFTAFIPNWDTIPSWTTPPGKT